MADVHETEARGDKFGRARQTHVALLSSFVLFLLSGLFVLYLDGAPSGWISAKATYPSAQVFVWAALLANGTYFYFFASLLEHHTNLQAAVQALSAPRRVIEYLIRLANHVLILVLWTAFQDTHPYLFAAYLVALYVTFIAWDLVARKALLDVDMWGLIWFDLAGLALSSGITGLLMWGAPAAIGDSNARYWMALGMTCLGYAALAVLGIRYGVSKGYRPWKWNR